MLKDDARLRRQGGRLEERSGEREGITDLLYKRLHLNGTEDGRE